MLSPWKKTYDKPRQCIKKQRYHFAKKVCIVNAMVFPVVVHGCERRLRTEELMISHCGDGGDFWESLGLQTDQTSQS